MTRFAIVGTLAFGVDYGLYHFLLLVLDIAFAKAVSFLAATLFTFILNRVWSFGLKERDPHRIAPFVFLYSFSLLLNTTVNKVGHDMTGNELIAFVSATAVSSVFNFAGLKAFVFRHPNVTTDYSKPCRAEAGADNQKDGDS